jgi:outer membrane lipoprotein-sorting protein
MKSRWSGVLFVAGVAVLVGWASSGFGQTVDEVLQKMAAKAETIKDLQVGAKVTKFDSVFEEKTEMRLEVWYRKPDLTRVDSFKKAGGKEVQTQLIIIGKDFVLRAWPETRKAEIRRMPADEMKARRESRNDPLTFFSRKPDDLKKDFDVTLLPAPSPVAVKMALRPRNDKAGVEYKCLELVVDKVTWLPTAVRVMAGGDKDDWSLYEFTRVLLNTSFPDAVFAIPGGYQVQEVDKDAPVKEK